MDERDLARTNGIGRALIGASLVLAPRLTTRAWLGDDASSAGTKVAARALGIRDLALGIGLVMALERRDPVRNWVAAAAAADGVDAAATLLAWGDLPRAGRVGVLALATGSAVQMGLLARRVP